MRSHFQNNQKGKGKKENGVLGGEDGGEVEAFAIGLHE
jgi:hypothetical protein